MATNIAHSNLTGSDLHEPKGASTATSGQVYVADGAGSGAWTTLNISGAQYTTGDLKPTFKTSADDGWIIANDGTIGDVSSGGTTRADGDTQDLFILLWTDYTNTLCPVAGGRGSSAIADFNAHKTIRLPLMEGRVIGAAGSGSGLTSRTAGTYTGTETHVLSTSEMPSHSHTGITDTAGNHQHEDNSTAASTSAQVGGDFQTRTSSTGITGVAGSHSHTLSINNSGGGGAHNNMQPSNFFHWMIKL